MNNVRHCHTHRASYTDMLRLSTKEQTQRVRVAAADLAAAPSFTQLLIVRRID